MAVFCVWWQVGGALFPLAVFLMLKVSFLHRPKLVHLFVFFTVLYCFVNEWNSFKKKVIHIRKLRDGSSVLIFLLLDILEGLILNIHCQFEFNYLIYIYVGRIIHNFKSVRYKIGLGTMLRINKLLAERKGWIDIKVPWEKNIRIKK